MADDQKSFISYTPGAAGKEIEAILRPLQVSDQVKAQAYADYFNSKDERDFTTRFKSLEGFPNEMKAQLYAHKYGQQKHPSSMLTPEGMGEIAVAEMPAIGATAGGALAGPLGVPVGAALGTAGRQLIRSHKGQEVPTTVGGSLAEMGVEAGKQSAYELGGRAVSAGLRGLRRIAPPMYESAIRGGLPELKNLEGGELERTIAEQREITERGVRTRTPVSVEGAKQAGMRVGETKPKVTAEVSAATQANKTIKTADILKPLDDQIALWSAPDPADAKSLVKQRTRIMNALASKGQDQWMTPNEAQALKEQLSKQLSSKAFRQGAPTAGKIAGKTAQYGGFKGAIEQVAPGVEEANRAIHLDLALKDAILRAEKKHPGWIKNALGTIGGAVTLEAIGHRGLGEAWVVGGLIRQAMQEPRVMGRLAIMLEQAGVQLPKFAEPTVKYGLRFGLPLTEDLPPSRLNNQNDGATK